MNKLYGDVIRIVGLPDFPNDNASWMELLTDLIRASFAHLEEYDIVFYGGSHEDVDIFHEHGYATKIVDRTKVPVSATVIRDLSLRGMDVSDFLDERIHGDFVRKFAKVMEESEKWETPDL